VDRVPLVHFVGVRARREEAGCTRA
jgi:hypothetical protein